MHKNPKKRVKDDLFGHPQTLLVGLPVYTEVRLSHGEWYQPVRL